MIALCNACKALGRAGAVHKGADSQCEHLLLMHLGVEVEVCSIGGSVIITFKPAPPARSMALNAFQQGAELLEVCTRDQLCISLVYAH